MQIRKAKTSDAERCFNIFLKYGEEYWTIDDFNGSAKDEDVIFLVAEDDSTIVGYIIGFFVPTRRSEAGLHETRVDRTKGRQGIGSALVNEFVRYAFESGATIVSASVEEELLPFYEASCGFKRAGEWIELKEKEENEKQ